MTRLVLFFTTTIRKCDWTIWGKRPVLSLTIGVACICAYSQAKNEINLRTREEIVSVEGDKGMGENRAEENGAEENRAGENGNNNVGLAKPEIGAARKENKIGLAEYIDAAKNNSPLLKDYQNQTAIQEAELERLKGMYLHSRLEVNGEYLFVPIVSRDGGKPQFEWNAQSANDYYGYDLGESSGHLYAGLSWSQPLLGYSLYKVARTQAEISKQINDNRIQMEEHQLERAVTEQYLLCLLSEIEMEWADSVDVLLQQQINTVERMVAAGMAKQSDLRLLRIEQQANTAKRISGAQSYRSHLTDLNLLCGIADTSDVVLADAGIRLSAPTSVQSRFAEQFRLDSLSTAHTLQSYNLQYKPSLDLFVDGGLRTSSFSGWYQHFGWSAGLTFKWTIFDGGQKKWRERQATLQQNTIASYRQHADYQRAMRLGQCLYELRQYEERGEVLREQLSEYEAVLADYEHEMSAGQVSVIDYISVLRSRIQTERDYRLLLINKQLVITAYNYWNW